jgi:hypothetical protein
VRGVNYRFADGLGTNNCKINRYPRH